VRATRDEGDSYKFFDVFGEQFKKKVERKKELSKYGSLNNWHLISFIVKAGDDLWQEQFVMQLLVQFQKIFPPPLYIRTYTILGITHDAGLIETITDAVSVHSLKKNTPNFTNLRNYFIQKFGPPESPPFKTAQNNFVTSMAAYSIVTYLLQIKDRHNGNILLDSDGHIIHIDFGFLFTNSPGGMNFERAPFKLTQEMVDVMDGVNSVAYNSFCKLCVGAFLRARANYEKIMFVVELMLNGAPFPCFSGGYVLETLKERFQLHLSKKQCVDYVLKLINQSLNNFRTKQYDVYQNVTNGICI